MGLKDKLPVLNQDKANHHIYGTWSASIASTIFLAAALGLRLMQPPLAVLIAMCIQAGTAFAAGWVSEKLDERVNAAAVKAGLAPPREVSDKDLLATALGAVPVLLPVAAIVIFML